MEANVEERKLTSRDLIALGVFSLLFMIVSMLVVGLTSISVIAYCGCCAIAAIPAGIVWTYMHVRIPRAGTSLVMAYYRALMGSNNIDPSYMESMLSFVTPQTFAAIAAVTIVGALIGAFLGRTVFKKHFERAGIA